MKFISIDIIVMAILVVLGIIGFLWKKRIIRYITLVVSLGYFGFYYGICLVGPGQVQYLTKNVSRFGSSIPFYIKMAIIIIPAFVLGPVFCGWVCPMGAFQEIFNISRSENNRINFTKVDNYLRYIRFGALIVLLIYPFFGKEIIHNLNPFRVIFRISFIPDYPILLMIFGGIIVISSIFIHRPWCRYLCPFGALMSVLSKISFFKIKLTRESECVSCGICQRTCRIGAIKMKDNIPEIMHERCIRCGECIMPCPKHGLEITCKKNNN